MSSPIRLSHNVSVLIYHFACPAKYRRVVFDEHVDETIKDVCQEIELRYDIKFLEIGTDKDHVHFLVQAVPKLSPCQIIRTVKSITAREVFVRCPQVKKKLWGGEFWSDAYCVSTVDQHGSEDAIRKYVQNQGVGQDYVQLHMRRLSIF